MITAATFAARFSFALLVGCGGGQEVTNTAPQPSSQAPVVTPPPAPNKPVALRMFYEYTESNRNLYSSAECRRGTRVVPCELPTDVLNKTYLTIQTTSNALADGALTLAEITSVDLMLQLWPDTQAQLWRPGHVALEFKSDQSNLVAVETAQGWRLYELASIKSAAAEWCHANCDTDHKSTNRVSITQSWFGTIDVDNKEYYVGDSVLDFRQHMFLSGPFVDRSKTVTVAP